MQDLRQRFGLYKIGSCDESAKPAASSPGAAKGGTRGVSEGGTAELERVLALYSRPLLEALRKLGGTARLRDVAADAVKQGMGLDPNGQPPQPAEWDGLLRRLEALGLIRIVEKDPVGLGDHLIRAL